MVVQTVLLVSAIALFGFLDAQDVDGWKPINLETEDIPIDFSESKLQFRIVGFRDPSHEYNKQIWVYFNTGSTSAATGLAIYSFYKSPTASWEVMNCGGMSGTPEGARGQILEEQVSKERDAEEIFTIWREDTSKLNFMINDNVVLDNYALLDEIVEGSCDGVYGSFSDEYSKKVTSVTFDGYVSPPGNINDIMTEYRIVPRKGDENGGGEEEGGDKGKDNENSFNRNGGSTPGELLNILMSLSTSIFIALTLF